MVNDSTLKAIQAASGLSFSVFSSLHIGGHLLTNFSYHLGEIAVFANRTLFHNPVFELGVIGGSLIVHVTSSYWRGYIRKPTKSHGKLLETKMKEINLHRTSGYLLSFFMIGHIGALRILPLALLEDPSVIDLTYASYALLQWKSLFYPYYIALLFTGIYHTCYGINQALHAFGTKVFQPKIGFWLYFAIGAALVSLSTTLAVGGLFGDIEFTDINAFKKVYIL
ncbi:hypothetical protein HDV01_007761 [Terramyces sp. JEL0728]|nr:hypothetical protein HDV01_007761 [Terramyces sp. JEL0728]